MVSVRMPSEMGVQLCSGVTLVQLYPVSMIRPVPVDERGRWEEHSSGAASLRRDAEEEDAVEFDVDFPTAAADAAVVPPLLFRPVVDSSEIVQ